MHKKLAMFCIMTILLPFLVPSAPWAQGCLSVLPDTTVAMLGGQFSLDVAVNDPVDSLMGYDVMVGFDRSYLEVVSVEEGSLPTASGHATFFRRLNEGCACDSISVNGSILGDTVDGPGTLFTMTFKALKPGKTNVAIRRSDLRNGMNRKLPHCSEDALVIIEPPIGSDACSWSRVKDLYK
jgi:general secretion pathway protein D